MKMLPTKSPYRPGESPYEIFTNRMAAITAIVTGIKQRILNKYNKGVTDTIIGQLEKALTPEQATETISILNTEPTDIYPSGIEEMAGQFVDTFNMMNKKLTQKGLIGSSMELPSATTPTSEVMIPKGDNMQLLNAIMNMPGGQMDFAPILNYMKEHRPKIMGSFSPQEQWALNQAMGQISDPKKELGEGLDLAKKYKEYFEEPTAGRPGKYPYTEQEVKDYELWKKSQEESETQIDFNKLNEFIEAHNMKLSGVSVNPKTGNYSYSFTPRSTDKSWGDFLEEADRYIKENPDMEITSTNPKTGSVTIEKKGRETTDKVTTAEISLVEKQFTGVKTNAQYDEALAIVRQTDKNVIVPTKEEQFMGNYNKAKIAIIKTAIDVNTGKIREGEYKAGLSYIDVYKALYEDLMTAIREYQLATGRFLDNPFLSFEEYEKTDVKPRKILSSSTWGQQKSVFKDEHSYITGETEKGIKGKEDEHGYIVGATYKNAEGKLLKYLGNNEWEEVNPTEEGRTRGIK